MKYFDELSEDEKFKVAFHCLKTTTDEEVCPECDLYGACHHTTQEDLFRFIIEQVELVLRYKELGTPAKILEKIGSLDVELGKYASIGTVEEFKSLKENDRKCEECAGCTNWLCDCANIKDRAIDDFYDKVLNFEDYIEPVKVDGTVQLYSGKDITDMIVKIKKELKETLS